MTRSAALAQIEAKEFVVDLKRLGVPAPWRDGDEHIIAFLGEAPAWLVPLIIRAVNAFATLPSAKLKAV